MEATNLQEFQKELLPSLRQLRNTLLEDIKNQSGAPAAGSSDKDARIAELEAENKRLNYQVLHLSKNLRERLN